MILESIVTTVDAEGRVNIAPMGPQVSDPRDPQFVLRPFDSSRTYANLVATGTAVIHVTDDAGLFARAAVDAITPESAQKMVRPIEAGRFWALQDCHRWFAVEIESTSGDAPRVDMKCRVVQQSVVRPFFGFNRAKHAVIEAAILATRTHLLDPESIQAELQRLRPLIDKTAGGDEHEAFDFLCRTIDERLAGR